jgi:hypothetical protein
LMLLMSMGESLALQYVNYTSYKYKIQFQYPTDWVQGEKISIHDPGADISVTELSNIDPAVFLIVRGHNSELGSDLMTVMINIEKTLGDIFQYELELPISQTTIGGQKTASLIYSINDNHRDRELESVHQIWLTYVGEVGYYLILFTAPRYSFSNLEITEIRNQFIKSISSLDKNNY